MLLEVGDGQTKFGSGTATATFLSALNGLILVSMIRQNMLDYDDDRDDRPSRDYWNITNAPPKRLALLSEINILWNLYSLHVGSV